MKISRAHKGFGYSLVGGCDAFSPADSTVLYVGHLFTSAPTGVSGRYSIPIPKAGRITSYYTAVYIATTLGSAENVAIALFLNGATVIGDHNEVWNATPKRTVIENLNQPVASGDHLQLRITPPVWVTNPTNVWLSFGVVIEP